MVEQQVGEIMKIQKFKKNKAVVESIENLNSEWTSQIVKNKSPKPGKRYVIHVFFRLLNAFRS